MDRVGIVGMEKSRGIICRFILLYNGYLVRDVAVA